MSLTTDPTTPCLHVIKEDGQQACYLVLSDEERAKGFVRPVRQVYRHVKCGTETRMGLAIAETYARQPDFYGGTMCVHCGTHFPLLASEDIPNANHELHGVKMPTYEQLHGKMQRLVRQFEWIVNGKHDGSFVGE